MSPEQREKWMASRVKHGGYMDGREHPAHYTWRSMVARCTNPNHKAYNQYGGRGITVCERWMKYENFLKDMGVPPEKMSLDRIDNNRGYEPTNCKWATKSEQQKNKTTTKLYTNGVFCGTLVECAKHLGLSKELAHWRMKTWRTFEKGVTWLERPKV